MERCVTKTARACHQGRVGASALSAYVRSQASTPGTRGTGWKRRLPLACVVDIWPQRGRAQRQTEAGRSAPCRVFWTARPGPRGDPPRPETRIAKAPRGSKGSHREVVEPACSWSLKPLESKKSSRG